MNENLPVIIGFVENLMFTSRIESVAEQMGYRIHWMGEAALSVADKSEESLIGEIPRLNSGLILIDLGMEGIAWDVLIERIKDHPSKKISVICFGSHMDAETLKKARRSGADLVVARSRFFSTLPALIRKYIPSG